MRSLGLASVLAFFAASLLAGCTTSSPEEVGASDSPLISDVASMMQRADGLFDVICKNGRREVVSATDLLANRVCASGGGSVGDGETVIYRFRDCRSQDAIAAIHPQFDCRQLTEDENAGSLRDRTGFCKNFTGFPTTVRDACWGYRQGYARSRLSFYTQDFCGATPTATLEPDQSCDDLSDSAPPVINSLSSERGCRDVFQHSLRTACRVFRSSEGNADPF